MELLSADSILGLILFFMGIFILNYCYSTERKNFGKMKKLRTLKLYGRREKDLAATIQYDYKGSLMTLAGAALSLMGLIQILRSINWIDFL